MKQFYTVERCKEIIRQEGISEFAKRVLGVILHSAFQFVAYYVYESRPQTLPEIPAPDGLRLEINQIGKLVKFEAYFNENLAGRTLVALDKETQGAINQIPIKVDFENGQVCDDISRTFPKYRRRGVYTYIHYMVLKIYPRVRSAVEKKNKAPQRILTKLGSVIVGEGWRLNIVGLKFEQQRYYINGEET